jgi:hypothetical protein
MFQANAKVRMQGVSSVVTAMSYDELTGLLHVVDGANPGKRTTFKDLTVVESETLALGTPKSVSARSGVIAQAGSTGADIYVPAMSLRDELKRTYEQRRAFGQELVPHWFTATTSQTTFSLPKGWKVVSVYSAGALKREGASYDYTLTNDGFVRSAVFAVGLSISTRVCIMAKRVV